MAKAIIGKNDTASLFVAGRNHHESNRCRQQQRSVLSIRPVAQEKGCKHNGNQIGAAGVLIISRGEDPTPNINVAHSGAITEKNSE